MADEPESFSWLVRFGYGGRGVVYLLLGWLALGTRARVDGGKQAVFEMLQTMPLGSVLLVLLVVGLGGYVGFKLLCLVADVEHHGSDAKGIAHRLASLPPAIGYSLVAFSAFRFAVGLNPGAGGSHARGAVHSAFAWGAGGLAVGLVGIGFLAAAAVQARQAATGRFMHRVSGQAPAGVELVGRAGFAARAVVFAIVGWSLMSAAWFHHASDAKNTGEALASLRASGPVYLLVSVGLMAFGAFSLVVARFSVLARGRSRA